MSTDLLLILLLTSPLLLAFVPHAREERPGELKARARAEQDARLPRTSTAAKSSPWPAEYPDDAGLAAFDADDEDDGHGLDAGFRGFSRRRLFDRDTFDCWADEDSRINPATGLPMLGLYDVAGNRYGFNFSSRGLDRACYSGMHYGHGWSSGCFGGRYGSA